MFSKLRFAECTKLSEQENLEISCLVNRMNFCWCGFIYLAMKRCNCSDTRRHRGGLWQMLVYWQFTGSEKDLLPKRHLLFHNCNQDVFVSNVASRNIFVLETLLYGCRDPFSQWEMFWQELMFLNTCSIVKHKIFVYILIYCTTMTFAILST